MRKRTLASFGLSLVFMFAAIFILGEPIEASTDYGKRTTCDVPFSFYVGNDKMEAGKYEIQRLSETTYQIRNIESEKSVLVLAQRSNNYENSVNSAKLVFNQYGQHNFLRKIYTQPRSNGLMVSESKTERKVKKESESDENLAKNKRVVEIKAE
ncbi:MAG: hypothetical protein M3209_16980 [Acidobacteriota bacterium]|nr:hypothetical protein [Acidobacteriota bacterium]